MDGSLENAAFLEPFAIVSYQNGFLISDRGNHAVRCLDLRTKKVYTFAGNGKAGYQDGENSRALLDSPAGIAVGDDSTVYITDTGNHVIRAVSPSGRATTYAGGEEGNALGALSEVQFSQPTGLYWSDGVLYVADSGNHRIVAIADGQVALVAGASLTGEDAYCGGYLDGYAENALFSSPQGIFVDEDQTVYVADTGNGAVRMIQNHIVTTLSISGENNTYPVSPRGLWLDDGTLYVGDVFAQVVYSFDVQKKKKNNCGWKEYQGT